MRPDPDPLYLDANDRLQAIARILAGGLLRLRDRQALAVATSSASPANNLSDSSRNRLELVAATVLSGATWVDANRDPERNI